MKKSDIGAVLLTVSACAIVYIYFAIYKPKKEAQEEVKNLAKK